GEYCVTIEYFNRGALQGLSFESVDREGQSTTHSSCNKLDIVNTRWTQRRITIRRSEVFRFKMSVLGFEGRSFFAIRNIEVENGTCPEIITTPRPTENSLD